MQTSLRSSWLQRRLSTEDGLKQRESRAKRASVEEEEEEEEEEEIMQNKCLVLKTQYGIYNFLKCPVCLARSQPACMQVGSAIRQQPRQIKHQTTLNNWLVTYCTATHSLCMAFFSRDKRNLVRLGFLW